MRVNAAALIRPSRDNPAPFSSTGCASAVPMRSRHHWPTAAREASNVPRFFCVSPSVRNTCCAITLLLYLLMSRITSDKGGEFSSNAGLSPAGTRPSRTCPPTRPPISPHMAPMARPL